MLAASWRLRSAVRGRRRRTGGSCGANPPSRRSNCSGCSTRTRCFRRRSSSKISDEQFSRFLPRFKALQDARRQTLQQRTRVLADVRRLADRQARPTRRRSGSGSSSCRTSRDRGEAEARKAYDAIDQVLDLRQQAQFRIFEEQMERRKLELVTRARQANRANRGQRQSERVP